MPTKEQIEAAAKAIYDVAFGPLDWDDPRLYEDKAVCRNAAKAALEAAEQLPEGKARFTWKRKK